MVVEEWERRVERMRATERELRDSGSEGAGGAGSVLSTAGASASSAGVNPGFTLLVCLEKCLGGAGDGQTLAATCTAWERTTVAPGEIIRARTVGIYGTVGAVGGELLSKVSWSELYIQVLN